MEIRKTDGVGIPKRVDPYTSVSAGKKEKIRLKPAKDQYQSSVRKTHHYRPKPFREWSLKDKLVRIAKVGTSAIIGSAVGAAAGTAGGVVGGVVLGVTTATTAGLAIDKMVSGDIDRGFFQPLAAVGGAIAGALVGATAAVAAPVVGAVTGGIVGFDFARSITRPGPWWYKPE